MKLLKRFLFLCICSAAIVTFNLQSLNAEQIGEWSIFQQIDDVFLPDELNESLDSFSTLTSGISMCLPLLPLYETLVNNTDPVGNALLVFSYETAMYTGSLGLVYFSTELMKNHYKRSRPFPNESEDPYKSFPSRHTALSFAAAAFQSVYVVHNENTAGIAISVNISSWSSAILTGYLRAASGEHFITDVLAGAVIGSVIGITGGILASLT